MKTTEQILKYLMIVFMTISGIYFVYSIIDFINLENSEPYLLIFYNSIGKYSGLHGFTVVIIATYLGISRLRLSYESHQKTLDQLKLTEKEIQRRRDIEQKEETLKRCEYYLTEIQASFKELIQHEKYSGIPVEWSKLTVINRTSLEQIYKTSHDKIQKAEKELKSHSLLTLYKLEAFSAAFLHGNTEMELGKEMIGVVFCKQVGFLLGIIAYYRTEGNETLFENTLNLRNHWLNVS